MSLLSKDRATLGSDLSVSVAAYSMGRYPYDAAHLHACYRQKCDKSFFYTYHKAIPFFATYQLIYRKSQKMWLTVSFEHTINIRGMVTNQNSNHPPLIFISSSTTIPKIFLLQNIQIMLK